jgi:hypothetical protein
MRAPCTIVACALARVAAAETAPYAGVAVEELYDSNVMNGMGPDAVSRVSPRAGLLWHGERGVAGAEYLVALHAYAGGAAESSVNHRGELWTRLAATRRLNVGASLRIIAADDPVLLERAGVAVPNGAFVDVVAAARSDYRLTRRWTLDAEYAFRATRFDDAVGSVDGDEHRLESGGTHRLARRLAVGARGRWQRFAATTGTNEDALGATASVSWRWTRSSRLRAEGGPVWIEGDADWSAVAQVIHTGRYGRFTAGVSRELYGATGGPGAIRSDAAALDAAWRLGRRVVGRLRAVVYRNELAVSGVGQGSGALGRASVGWATASGRWRVDAYVEHRAQDGSGGLSFRDLERTLVGIRVSTLIGGVDPLALEEER